MTEKSENQKEELSLQSICRYNQKLLDDEFVGLRFDGKKFFVNFPLGYSEPKSQTDEELEKEYRSDIANLIFVLKKFCDKSELLCNGSKFAKDEKVEFPIHAYIFLINHFLNNGYYKEKEVQYKKSTNGKINWSRTIKQIRPEFINDNPIFLKFITKKINYNEEEIITQIHKYCVHESFSKIGFIFSNIRPEKSTLKFNADFFRSMILQKMSKTFDEKTQLLLKNMLDLINYVDKSNEVKTFYYGTEDFEHIFESLVDSVFGENDKEEFYPECYWQFENGNSKKCSLRPDTIMIRDRGTIDQKIFVLDSKYYKYGMSNKDFDLPGSDSIIKQIAYAEFIENSINREESRLPKDVKTNLNLKEIYNAFIMPANLQNSSNKNNFVQYFGYATTDYKSYDEKSNDYKKYHKIIGIKIDLKTLMNDYSKNQDRIEKLAKLISTQFATLPSSDG